MTELIIVYHGLGMAGKTTNLEKLKEFYTTYVVDRFHQNTVEGRTVFMDVLHLTIKLKTGDGDISVKLYTTPGQDRFALMRSFFFGKMDGIVLVIDTTRSPEENYKAYSEIEKYVKKIPMVVQFNKVDLRKYQVQDYSYLDGFSYQEAIAYDGVGVRETFRLIICEVLKKWNG